MAGANLLYGSGMIESGVTFDFAQLVLDNEFNRMVKFALGGIPVNDETLSVDVIAEVGAFKDFLSHEHTMKHMREQSPSALIDRRVRDEWEASGSQSLYDRATAKAREILDTYQPAPLPENVAAELRDIIADAEKDLGVASTAGRA